MKKRAAIILSGCGVYDGSEIHEAVLTLLALDSRDVQVEFLAPDKPQADVIDHLHGKPQAGTTRNVRTEAARIARGAVGDIAKADPGAYDMVLVPGGFGAAKNLCDFATRGADLEVFAPVAAFLKGAHTAGKPMGFICIAPVVAAKLFGADGVHLTIGCDPGTASAIQALGAIHENHPVDGVAIDKRLKIASTPAYMLGKRICEVGQGIDKLVDAVVAMA